MKPFSITLLICLCVLVAGLAGLGLEYVQRSRSSSQPPSHEYLKKFLEARDQSLKRLNEGKELWQASANAALSQWRETRENLCGKGTIGQRAQEIQNAMAAVGNKHQELRRKADALLEQVAAEQQRMQQAEEETQNLFLQQPGPDALSAREELRKLWSEFTARLTEFREGVERERMEFAASTDSLTAELEACRGEAIEAGMGQWIESELKKLVNEVGGDLDKLTSNFGKIIDMRCKEIKNKSVDELVDPKKQQQIKEEVDAIRDRAHADEQRVRELIKNQMLVFRNKVKAESVRLLAAKNLQTMPSGTMDKMEGEVKRLIDASLGQIDHMAKELDNVYEGAQKTLGGMLTPQFNKVLILVLGTNKLEKEDPILVQQLRKFLTDHKELDRRDTVQLILMRSEDEKKAGKKEHRTWRPGEPLQVAPANSFPCEEYTQGLFAAYRVYPDFCKAEAKVKVLLIWNSDKNPEPKVSPADPPEGTDMHLIWLNPPKEYRPNVFNTWFGRSHVRIATSPELASALQQQLNSK